MTETDLVLDSSCWIAWFDRNDPRERLVDDIADAHDGQIAVPAIVLYEVDRWMRRNAFAHNRRNHTIRQMRLERQIPIDDRIAMRAGVLARAHGLATADALIAGSASVHGCTLATFDADFEGVPGALVLG